MPIYSNEFFYCHDRFNDGKKNHDFSDNSLMTTEQRVEFLKEYADHLEKGESFKLTAELLDLNDNVVLTQSFEGVCESEKPFELTPFNAEVKDNGYYTIRYTLDK